MLSFLKLNNINKKIFYNKMANLCKDLVASVFSQSNRETSTTDLTSRERVKWELRKSTSTR